MSISIQNIPSPSTSLPSQNDEAVAVRIAPEKYWDWSFAQAVSNGVSDKGTLIATGSGMTVNQTGGNLVITTGTTANAETVIRTVASWTGALTIAELTTLSQRIANNNFYVELVDLIGDGLAYNIIDASTVDVTKTSHGFTVQNIGQRIDLCAITGAAGIPMEGVIASIPDADTIRFTVSGWPASGTGTLSLTGWNKIELNYTGTTATQVTFNTRRQGYKNTAVTATVSTTASGHIASVNTSNGIVSLGDQVATSAGALTNRATWKTNCPEPDIVLYYQIRAKNGTVAPATTTTWTVGMLRAESYVAQQMELTGTRQQSSGNTIPISGNISTVTTVSTVTAVTSANIGIPTLVADVASAALTTTTTTAAVTPTFGTTYVVNIPVTVVSGTNPTLDVVVQESDDTGTNWFDVYHFPRITATGAYRSPPLTLRGNRIRYVQTVAGTTPSFTRAINRLQRSDDAPLRTQFIDRTVNPNSLNSVTPTFFVEGCLDFNFLVRCTAQTGAATLTVQFSHDGTNWHTTTNTLATVVGFTHVKVQNEQWKFARLNVTAAGSGITLGEAMIVGVGS